MGVAMFYFIAGTLEKRADKYIVVNAGGIGYQIFVPLSNFSLTGIGEPVKAFVFAHIREDNWELYGFAEEEDLAFFKVLLSVSGVGPKLGVTMINAAGILALKKAIAGGDEHLLTSISGVGTKLAKRLIIELQAKAKDWASEEGVMDREDKDVFDALISFGYPPASAREAMNQTAAEYHSVEQRLKAALKMLRK